jgi:hypothetical protein
VWVIPAELSSMMASFGSAFSGVEAKSDSIPTKPSAVTAPANGDSAPAAQ